MLDAARSATPTGRLGTSEEIANVIFLTPLDTLFIHGQVIEINGGFRCPRPPARTALACREAEIRGLMRKRSSWTTRWNIFTIDVSEGE